MNQTPNLRLTGEESARLVFRGLRPEDESTWMIFCRHPQSSKYWSSNAESPEVRCKQMFEYTFERYATGRGGMNVLIDKKSGAFVAVWLVDPGCGWN